MRSTKSQHAPSAPSRFPRRTDGRVRFPKAKIFLLVSSLFLSAGTAWAATVNIGDRASLQEAVNATGNGGIINFNVTGITFPDYPNDGNGSSSGAVNIPTTLLTDRRNITLQGSIPSNFSSNIETLNDILLEWTKANKTATVAVIAAEIGSKTGSFLSSLPTNLTYIQGNGGKRTVSSGNVTAFDVTKWLDIRDADGSGLSLENLRFQNVRVENTFTYTSGNNNGAGGMTNGLIGSYSANTGTIGMGHINGNDFYNIDILLHGYRDTHYLAGGGLIGLRATGEEGATDASTTIETIEGNVFRGIHIETDQSALATDGAHKGSAYIEGGGVIGLDAVSSPANKLGHASIYTLSNNFFTGINVQSGDIILGGGVVGVNNNSQKLDPETVYAQIKEVSGNIFGNGALDTTTPENSDIYVKATYSLRGGGVIGVNGLSNAAARLDSLVDNIFAGIYVDTDSYLKGGGIVGVQSNDGVGDKSDVGTDLQAVSALLDNVEGNLFLNQRVDVGTYLYGGGILGARSNEGQSQLETLENNVFQGLEVHAYGNDGTADKNSLSGGGIVGVSSKEQGYIASVYNNLFDQLTVSTANQLQGGGILGAQAEDAEEPVPNVATSNFAVINDVTGNTFSSLKVESGAIQGGGLVGVWNKGGANGLWRMDHNRFWQSSVYSTSYISGGGLVGVWADEGYAVLNTLSNNTFYGYQSGADGRVDDVHAEQYIEGGGIVGVRSNLAGYIGKIENTWFAGLKVTAGTYIDGGGLVGATGPASNTNNLSIGIHEITDSVFIDNMITAKDGQIMGGLVYSYGLAGGLTITDSWFMNNEFHSDVTSSYDGGNISAKVYGTVTVDTGVPSSTPYTLTLKATSSGSTVFTGNEIYEDGKLSRTNSLYFGTIPSLTGMTGNLTAKDDPAKADARLVIDTASGGGVGLYDPIEVNQNNNKTFFMTVQGSGNFDWGGKNVFDVGAPGTIDLNSGTTTLLTDFSLDAPDHTLTLLSGARMNVLGSDSMNLAKADLNGTLFFNLYHTDLNKQDSALLTLEGDGEYSVKGSVIRLSNLKAGERLLHGGDRFYLIATENSGSLAGDPANNLAYARQGLLIGYNFIIDKQPDDGSTNQYLVARLVEEKSAVGEPLYVVAVEPQFKAQVGEPLHVEFKTQVGEPLHVEFREETGEPLVVMYKTAVGEPLFVVADDPAPVNPQVPPDVPEPGQDTPPTPQPVVPTPYNPPTVSGPSPADETTVLVGGRAAGLAFLAQWGGWLPDHSYQAADLALDENRSERAWVPFGGVDTGHWRLDTGSHIRLTGSSMQLGLATRHRGDSGATLLGVFLEAKQADYRTRNRFVHLSQESFVGDGDLDAVGGGLMARHTGNNDLRIEASLRTGRLKNDFRAKNYLDSDDLPARYKATDHYLAAHLGVGRDWQISEKNELDLLFRYYWTRLAGGTVRLSEQEKIHFDDSESRRVRLGGRLTHTWKENRFWYIGAAVERELDSKVDAHAYAVAGSEVIRLDLDTHQFKGTTTIGEIGLILRSRKDSPFSIEAGLQGYTGKFKGVSGGVRFEWEF